MFYIPLGVHSEHSKLSIAYFHGAAQKFLNMLSNYQVRCVQEFLLLYWPTTTWARLNANQIVGSSPDLFQEITPGAFNRKEYQAQTF